MNDSILRTEDSADSSPTGRSRRFRCASAISTLLCGLLLSFTATADGTRLLRQPTISDTHIAFVYGGDIWVSRLDQGNALRLTSTAAVESDPHFSPDGKTIAFTSNRSGSPSVYTVPVEGGSARRLSWHPAAVLTRGWTPDGKFILYATDRGTAPTTYNRLWTVSADGGPPSLLTRQWGHNGWFSPGGDRIVIDRMDRWDVEWRAYRGGQNTPLVVLDLSDKSEIQLPNNSSTDIEPVWIDDTIYFLSDRDWVSNVWAWSVASGTLRQVTQFKGADVKQLAGNSEVLVYEREGNLYSLDPESGQSTLFEIHVSGDFPWAETHWEDVSEDVESASLSPTGKRAIMASRGEIFTVPVEHGNSRNITRSSGAADRAPLWSPKGDRIAWFSDSGGSGYELLITTQDGLQAAERISIGESAMAWEPTWSPDGKSIAFVDDDVRVRVIDLDSQKIRTADMGGTNIERGLNGLAWSPDSNWLAYSTTGSNHFRRIKVWSRKDGEVRNLTNAFADAFSPAWDLGGKHLYFLASTDVALGSGWANTSSMTSRPVYAAYIINLAKETESPFDSRSDEEEANKESSEEKNGSDEKKKEEKAPDPVVIDFAGIERRILPMPVPGRDYRMTISGPAGSVFIGEQVPNGENMILQKFSLEEREAKPFSEGILSAAISADGNKLLVHTAAGWQVLDATAAEAQEPASLSLNLKMKLERSDEWSQIFEEAWRYQRDYFYDPDMHGRDWDEVYRRYAPLVPFIKHRSALTYVLDQVNGELSVGHSFVFGGDYPDVGESSTGLLGADLVVDKRHWKIERIYTSESWNPELSGPLDKPGLNIETGHYLVGVNGQALDAGQNPYSLLEGTADVQTVLHINDKPDFESSWKEFVTPIKSENALRQRVWVEDNRRMVDRLSDGKLGYVWVPNTSTAGLVSFNRYFFGQQDKEGAVIDERFNGGGLLDDYMVDLMNRTLRAAITNEVPGGQAFRLPAGILGPKVLLINELAGSGGDFFPWVFRQQQTGPLIGRRTWGGLVKSSVHYSFVDGGRMTAPDNAVFDPINSQWIAENEGVGPDIEVYQDAKSLDEGRDPQLERAVIEALKLLEERPAPSSTPPPFSKPAGN